jgi:type II secretory pathway component PulK
MKNKGSVLIFVLLMTSFCLGIAFMVNENAMESYSFASNVHDYTQSSIYAVTAIEGVMKLIKDDNKKFDSEFDDWTQIPSISVENGYISIKVIPINSKINLLNLRNDNEKVRNLTLSSLIDFFKFNDFESPMILKDWIDNDSDISEEGLEDWEFEKNGVIYSTKNSDLNTLYEINYLFDNKVYEKMKYLFTSVNYGTKININFASKEVLDYWLPELKEYSSDIIDYRKNKAYKDISQIRKAANISLELYSKIAPYITEKSSFFYLLIEVNLNGFSRYYHSLIKRKTGKVNLVSFFEGANELYY